MRLYNKSSLKNKHLQNKPKISIMLGFINEVQVQPLHPLL